MKSNLNGLDRVNRIKELIRFMRMNDLTCELGWFEHTGDWDPFLLITLESGAVIETSAGYSEIEIVGYRRERSIEQDSDKLSQIKVYVDINEEECEVKTVYIDIDKIKSIAWRAH